MNYTEVIKELVSGVIESIRKEIVNASFDKTFKAKVIGKVTTGKYQILYKGKKYYATCETSLSTGDIVKVCAPQNNWSELFIMTFGTGGSGGGTVVSGVSGVKGSAEDAFRDGDVIISPENIGLGKVENKSSEDIRNEITSENVTNALGYSPIDPLSEEYNNIKLNSHTHENKETLDDITKEMVTTLGEIVEEGFKITVDAELSDTSENPVQNKVIKKALDTHTHNYAGSTIPGGVANSANKLETARKINGVDFDGTEDINIEAGDNMVEVTKAEYEEMLSSGTIDENTYYAVIDDEEMLPEKIMSGYVYVDEEAIETPVEEILLDADKFGGELPEAYVKKTDISNEQVNDENKIPTSALVYRMNDDLNGKAASSHTHDDRYYTESEVNNLLNTHKSSGDHDGRYYTETEIDNKLSYTVINSSPLISSHTGTNIDKKTNLFSFKANKTGMAIISASIQVSTSKSGSIEIQSYNAKIRNRQYRDTTTASFLSLVAIHPVTENSTYYILYGADNGITSSIVNTDASISYCHVVII